jgi:hypothetical protein
VTEEERARFLSVSMPLAVSFFTPSFDEEHECLSLVKFCACMPALLEAKAM